MNDCPLVDALRQARRPLTGPGLGALAARAASARYVLIGEETHGTREFYALRAELTRRLIAEHGFHGVCLEADRPDAARASRYARGLGSDRSAGQALGGFARFPAWMWRNREVRDFVEWLRTYNQDLDGEAEAAGLHGLDLYSLHASAAAVVDYLEGAAPALAGAARERYACFDPYTLDLHDYARASAFGRLVSCERPAQEQLAELESLRPRLASPSASREEADDYFEALQNARVVVAAERYYRTMYEGGPAGWNQRDGHMAETLFAVARHLDARVGRSKLVVWAHSSHLGDARATSFADDGQLNLGQLVREAAPGECFLIGQTTHAGAVTAASDWGEPAEHLRVRPALAGSAGDLLHEVGPRFWLDLRGLGEAAGALREARPQRAIGVVYRPRTERLSHYFEAKLAEQFDAVIHVDRTHALEPLDPTQGWQVDEPPETYPSAL